MVEDDVKIEIWSDVACPWCYIGKRRFESALADFAHKDDVDIAWRSYQLDPSLPEHFDGTEIEYLADRKGMPADSVANMFAQVTEQAAGEGLAYDFGSIVVANSFSAHQLIHLASSWGKGDDVKEALLSGHFEHGEDIGSREYLVRTGVAAGLNAEEINHALDSEQFADDVRADIAEAQALGVTGVPFFVIDRKYGISGAQPKELFAQALAEAWTEAHPLTMVAGATDDAACGPDGCAI